MELVTRPAAWRSALGRVVLSAAVLLAAVAAAPPPPAADVAPADAAGRQAFERGCSGCHALEIAAGPPRSAGEWAAVIDMMIARGATLSDADQDAIIAYLAQRPSEPR